MSKIGVISRMIRSSRSRWARRFTSAVSSPASPATRANGSGSSGKLDWRKHVETDPRYYRPAEVDHLLGDSSKARAKLGWAPKVSFQELVKMMVEHDLELAQQEKTLRAAGHKIATRGGNRG